MHELSYVKIVKLQTQSHWESQNGKCMHGHFSYSKFKEFRTAVYENRVEILEFSVVNYIQAYRTIVSSV
jgi:hypothetical protein